MKVLVACEFSGIVRDAFAAKGHDAWSCDYRDTERPGNHYQCSVLSHDIVNQGWDLMIAHPDCTYLTVSGARWMNLEWRQEAQMSALLFVKSLWKYPIDRIAIENPVGKLSSLWRGPDQIVEPYHFGDPYKKATCLWLKNLPPLIPTDDLGGGRTGLLERAARLRQSQEQKQDISGIGKCNGGTVGMRATRYGHSGVSAPGKSWGGNVVRKSMPDTT